ncbi:MAG: DnaB-like helicase N-terminal domain-containing protein, partial [Verrucomicrobiota bacterium]|nr:DnaB-like helicase N-terminal domain-containing protein [Verrucomicrobiota bacterium]
MTDVPEATPLPEKDLKYTPRQRENQTVVPIGRTPTNDVAAEQGVLGCVLLDPHQNLPACIEKVKDETVFYDLRHQAIYAAMVAMYEETAPIDLLTLSHQLRSAGELDNIGGVAYLTELQDSVPSAANLEYYFEIVRDQALLRRMIQTCTKAIADAYDETGEVDR